MVSDRVREPAIGDPPPAGGGSRFGHTPKMPIETVVIMVTDLVGSTALGSRLGSARFDRFRREHDSLVSDAAEDLGGRVVKNTGDGFLVAFSSVAVALAVAVSIQQRLERRNRGAGERMDVRIGISVGDAVAEAGDYFGLPPTQAARLCGAAQGGEILIADTVRAVLFDPAGYELESAGALMFKGMPEAVIVWSVLWRPNPAGPSLPAGLPTRHEMPGVGRAAARGALQERWSRAADGQRQMVLISGEQGIGKTRLMAQTALTIDDDDALILYGRCDEDAHVPYHPWRAILGDLVRQLPRRLLRPRAAELSRLVADLVSERLGGASAPIAADPETERHLLSSAVASLLSAAAAELGPVLIMLDDLHWADEASLLLLKQLVIAAAPDRLMVIGAFRDSDVEEGGVLRRLLADLHRESGVTRLALQGLDQARIVELIERLAGHEIGAAGCALAREIHRDSAGNPFFVGELIRHMRESGVITAAADGRWSFGAPLAIRRGPQCAREVVERRVRRLGSETRELLSVGAVIGGEFDATVVARAAGVPAPRVLDLLDRAIAASLVTQVRAGAGRGNSSHVPTNLYAFNHGLVRTELYHSLSPARLATVQDAVGGSSRGA